MHGAHFESSILYETINGVSKRGRRQVDLLCIEKGGLKKHTVDVAPDERDAFIADLLDRIESLTGQRISVSG